MPVEAVHFKHRRHVDIFFDHLYGLKLPPGIKHKCTPTHAGLVADAHASEFNAAACADGQLPQRLNRIYESACIGGSYFHAPRRYVYFISFGGDGAVRDPCNVGVGGVASQMQSRTGRKFIAKQCEIAGCGVVAANGNLSTDTEASLTCCESAWRRDHRLRRKVKRS